MNSKRRGLALSIVGVAVPVTLLLGAAPAASAKRDWAGRAVEVGPIWNQADAEIKCAKAARKAGGSWTGQWRTTKPGQMSVCEIKSGRGGKGKTIEVGPIWNQADAEIKCRKAARKAGVRWTGQWWTTQPGRMSVCEIKPDRGVKLTWPEPTKGTAKPSWEDQSWRGTRMVEVGPIWNQIDAESKCPRAAGEVRGRWTGQWKTTRPGQMSVCEIAR